MDILVSKVFTFDRRLARRESNVGSGEDSLKFGAALRTIKIFQGVDDEYMPKFRYIQFKKSIIHQTVANEPHKVMLCFYDISQKIFYDNSKAERELLSLINSTISHEMRNPLNSIINQCKIQSVLSIKF